MSESGNGSGGNDEPTRQGPDPSRAEQEQRYRLDARIATGGMGEVWRATDLVLGREVAVKLLKPEYTDDPTFRSRFETEARNAAMLHHANVATVFDFGEFDDIDGSDHPRPYLVMELVRGEPLSALMRPGEPMPADTAAHLLAQVADGLAAAHDLGLVHRDVKPANLLVTPDRTVKITDFGIARAADAVALTQTGQVIGTPQYFSPEQAEGKAATPASDVYSVGVVLYECLAGRKPFAGDSPVAVALAHLREEPPPLPGDVPARLRQTVEVALAKDPEARFASARDLASALRGGPVKAGPGGAVPDDSPTRVAPAVAGAAAGLAAGGVAADDDVRDVDDGTSAYAPVPPPGDEDTSRKRRFPAWVPWVAAALAVLAVVLVLQQLSDDARNDETPEPTETTSAPAQTPSEEPTTEQPEPEPSDTPTQDDRVTVRRGDYVGRPADEAQAELEALGLQVTRETVENPGDQEAGTVAEVSPTGRVEPDATITLSVYDEPVETPPAEEPTEVPNDVPTDGSSGEGDGGDGGEG